MVRALGENKGARGPPLRAFRPVDGLSGIDEKRGCGLQGFTARRATV